MKTFLFTLIIISFTSCNYRDNAKSDKIDYSKAEIIDNSKNTSDLIGFSKRNNQDLVEHLFNEAKKKDAQLESLVQKTNRFAEIKSDSLHAIYEYIRYNELYYTTIEKYLNRIQDSIKRTDITNIFKKSKTKYK